MILLLGKHHLFSIVGIQNHLLNHHGPIDYNFREIYARLQAAEGAIAAGTSGDIAAALIALKDPKRRAQLAENARACLRTGGAATHLTIEKITQLLDRGPR